ncbi:PREDICTED: chymotrypsin-2-like [Ceratosolen solmsi marchali]|uniref:Chymotrypsin-2-like n=1 Tax=Ceratosolen solmsi marchali TaxID=326594 RepID=A0AAJ6YFZ9_9HYME|nr:PREDICTED: chymotrypsin-2-like [Ceratosolen solmsi marchali]
MVLITGWGMFENPSNSLASPTLRVAMGMILDNYDCSSRVQYTIAEHQLCTIDTYGTGVCINDGGGSIVSNGVIYGIISYSLNNVGGFPDVHTKVYYYLDFIRNHMTE